MSEFAARLEMSEAERQVWCNGHHDRRRGIQRYEAPVTHMGRWLDGWDSADGELWDSAINEWHIQEIDAALAAMSGE